jgi:hypothetical protein
LRSRPSAAHVVASGHGELERCVDRSLSQPTNLLCPTGGDNAMDACCAMPQSRVELGSGASPAPRRGDSCPRTPRECVGEWRAAPQRDRRRWRAEQRSVPRFLRPQVHGAAGASAAEAQQRTREAILLPCPWSASQLQGCQRCAIVGTYPGFCRRSARPQGGARANPKGTTDGYHRGTHGRLRAAFDR